MWGFGRYHCNSGFLVGSRCGCTHYLVTILESLHTSKAWFLWKNQWTFPPCSRLLSHIHWDQRKNVVNIVYAFDTISKHIFVKVREQRILFGYMRWVNVWYYVRQIGHLTKFLTQPHHPNSSYNCRIEDTLLYEHVGHEISNRFLMTCIVRWMDQYAAQREWSWHIFQLIVRHWSRDKYISISRPFSLSV